MSDLADLFPGFQSEWTHTQAGRIFARIGGSGPPLLLLHGYPQSNVMWHRVAPELAKHFTLVIADLPGYGWSDAPETDEEHTPYTKRFTAQVMIEMMEKLGHARFAIAGHDRGGRVSYRMALDHPGRLSKIAVLDILPTYEYWNKLNRIFSLRLYHWMFLAQPAPLPEKLIGGAPDDYMNIKMAQGTGTGDLSVFDPRAFAHYLAANRDPLRIHAGCEDYRAGAYQDYDHDAADLAAGKKITIPLLTIWGGKGLAAAASQAHLDTWRKWATDVRGEPIESGHYLPEENPRDTARALIAFFSEKA